jgi:1-deoxy-D-xylulose-5-phosphate reductoisomerase
MPSKQQSVVVLGSTGSIGANTLDVMARHPDRYSVFALTAHSRVDLLEAQCLQWRPPFAAVTRVEDANELKDRLHRQGLSTEVLAGEQALVELASHETVDTVMAAIVGAAGLSPCMAAARTGKRLLLANKEALVVGGKLFMDAVHEGGAMLLPIDSEHSAVFQCLPEDRGTWHERIDHIVLTASGGPFRQRANDTLHEITPDEACAHPNWVMGRKISVDSATMMNKALEVIEARWLFDLEPRQVKVVIHPQSIIHSMVVCKDHSVLAQLGTPDMRVPIAYGLSFPERIESGASTLDFASLSALTFEAATRERFPGLFLAWDALEAAEGSTTVLNAANEIAVEAFLSGTLRYTAIHTVNASTLDVVTPQLPAAHTIDDLVALDGRARAHARQLVRSLQR